MDLIMLILFIMIFCIGFIVLHSLITNCSLEDSTHKFKEGIVKIFKALFGIDESSKTVLRIGSSNGFDAIIYDRVENVFESIYGLFQICVLDSWLEYNHYILYIFKATEPINMQDNIVVVKFIKKIAEKIVMKILRTNGIFESVLEYVTVFYDSEILKIAIAKNDDGFDEIKTLDKQYRREMLNYLDFYDEEMEESWNNEFTKEEDSEEKK